MVALGQWGRQLPRSPGTVHNTDALVLALKWAFDPSAVSELDGCYELRLRDDRFCVEVAQGRIEVRRGEAPDADVVIETDPHTLETVVFDDRPLREAEREGRLSITGDRALAQRFFRHYRGRSVAPVPG